MPSLFAQGDARYLYIQSEPVRRFELIQAGVVKGASPMGYLILPGLPAGVVEFILRMETDQVYRIDLTEGDRGLGLRKKSDAWQLVDLKTGQTLDPVLATAVATPVDSSGASPFARLLSKAVQDPRLLSNRRSSKAVQTIVQLDAPKPKDSLEGGGVSVAVVEPKIVPDTSVVAIVGETVPEPVRLLRAVENKGLLEATYLVREGERVDTIRLEFASLKEVKDTLVKDPVALLPVGCLSELTEPEFLQLRTRMAAAQDEDEMVLLVRRVVRTQCLSVSQIRRLSNVFLYDETRYRFFDAVHGHVTDPALFPELAVYLSDPVYQRRFRALLER